MTVTPIVPAPRSSPPLLTLLPPPVALVQAPLPVDEDTDVLLPWGGEDDDRGRSAGAIARALAEVLAGRRAPSQVRAILVPRVARLVDHLVRSREAHGMSLAIPLRVQAPSPDALEVSARLALPERSAALALRLERRGARWVVASLEAGVARDSRWPARS